MTRSRAAAAVGLFLVLRLAVPAAAAPEPLLVTTTATSGSGSLRAAIEAANRAPGTTIRVALPAGVPDEILVERSLPPLKARGTRLLGGGVTLREAPGCQRPGPRDGCDGIVVTGPDVVVRDLRLAGFTFDGLAVRGPRARDVEVTGVHAIDNLDDGIGVSAGAGPVRIRGCVLMGNGFRTKGKGLLVFDRARALLRDSVLVANRDGITATRGSLVELDGVLVVGSYDKGIGVSAATARGRRVAVLASGRSGLSKEKSVGPAPNADGLRAGRGGTIELSGCRIAGSGDAGVVVLDTSSVKLGRCTVEANRGPATRVSAEGRLLRAAGLQLR